MVRNFFDKSAQTEFEFKFSLGGTYITRGDHSEFNYWMPCRVSSLEEFRKELSPLMKNLEIEICQLKQQLTSIDEFETARGYLDKKGYITFLFTATGRLCAEDINLSLTLNSFLDFVKPFGLTLGQEAMEIINNSEISIFHSELDPGLCSLSRATMLT